MTVRFGALDLVREVERYTSTLDADLNVGDDGTDLDVLAVNASKQ